MIKEPKSSWQVRIFQDLSWLLYMLRWLYLPLKKVSLSGLQEMELRLVERISPLVRLYQWRIELAI